MGVRWNTDAILWHVLVSLGAGGVSPPQYKKRDMEERKVKHSYMPNSCELSVRDGIVSSHALCIIFVFALCLWC